MEMWNPYMHIWKVDKDAFLANYREERHTAEEFDYLYINYSNLANSVQVQETINQVLLNDLVSNTTYISEYGGGGVVLAPECYRYDSDHPELGYLTS